MLAHLALDQGCRATLCKRRGKQEMIDAQAEIFLETEHAVIPPGKTFLGLVEQAKTVFQTAIEQGAKGGALGRRTQNFA